MLLMAFPGFVMASVVSVVGHVQRLIKIERQVRVPRKTRIDFDPQTYLAKRTREGLPIKRVSYLVLR